MQTFERPDKDKGNTQKNLKVFHGIQVLRFSFLHESCCIPNRMELESFVMSSPCTFTVVADVHSPCDLYA
jgi:hypothetical protein